MEGISLSIKNNKELNKIIKKKMSKAIIKKSLYDPY